MKKEMKRMKKKKRKKKMMMNGTSVAFAGAGEGEGGADEGAQDGPAEDGHRIAADEFADEAELTGLEAGHHVGLHQVEVLLAKLARLVLDLAGVVAHDEGRLALLRHLVILVVLVDRVELLQQRLVGGARETETNHRTIHQPRNYVALSISLGLEPFGPEINLKPLARGQLQITGLESIWNLLI